MTDKDMKDLAREPVERAAMRDEEAEVEGHRAYLGTEKAGDPSKVSKVADAEKAG